jgi:hypothetical protein
MQTYFVICPFCGKKGWHKDISRRYARFECKYCKLSKSIAKHIAWNCWIPFHTKLTHEMYEEIKAYMIKNDYIDVDEKYKIKWE